LAGVLIERFSVYMANHKGHKNTFCMQNAVSGWYYVYNSSCFLKVYLSIFVSGCHSCKIIPQFQRLNVATGRCSLIIMQFA